MTRFHAGAAYNVIPETAEVAGTVRCLSAGVRDLAERRIGEIVRGLAAAHGAAADLSYDRNYPVTLNHPASVTFAAAIAGEVAGAPNVATDSPPLLAGEDFAYMLEQRPGAYIFIGNGDSAGLHNAGYDFNDEVIPLGCSYWARLVETAMPA